MGSISSDASRSQAARKASPQRMMPHASHARRRNGSSAIEGNKHGAISLSPSDVDFSSERMATPARAPNTTPSSSELLASRFAPCAPVHATSPAA